VSMTLLDKKGKAAGVISISMKMMEKARERPSVPKEVVIHESLSKFSRGFVSISKIKGSNLKAVEMLGGKNDPFVDLAYGSAWKAKTSVISSGGDSAEWVYGDDNLDMEFEASFADLKAVPMKAMVMDHNDMMSHALIGEGTGLLSGLLESRYGQRPHHARERLEPVTASVREAEALEVDEGAPLMLVERTAYSRAGLPPERCFATIGEAARAVASDAIAIAAPSPLHAALCGEALRAGRHVIVEKPFTVEFADARVLAALAEQGAGAVVGQLRELLDRHAGAAVAHRDDDPRAGLQLAHLHLGGHRLGHAAVAARVLQQDERHLLARVPLGQDVCIGEAITNDGTLRREQFGLTANVVHQRLERQRLGLQLATHVGARKHQQLMHQTNQALYFILRVRQHFCLFARVERRRAMQQLDVAAHGRQRCAQFMICHCEELAFFLLKLLRRCNILKHNHRFADDPVGLTDRCCRTEHDNFTAIRAADQEFLVGTRLAPQGMDEGKVPTKG